MKYLPSQKSTWRSEILSVSVVLFSIVLAAYLVDDKKNKTFNCRAETFSLDHEPVLMCTGNAQEIELTTGLQTYRLNEVEILDSSGKPKLVSGLFLFPARHNNHQPQNICEFNPTLCQSGD